MNGHLGLSGRSTSAPAADESKGMLGIARWVTTVPAPGGTLYMYVYIMVTDQTTDLHSKMSETGDGPNRIPNPEYFLPLGSNTNDLGSPVH